MSELFRTLVYRVAALFRRGRLEGDLDDELRSHLEMAIEINLLGILPPTLAAKRYAVLAASSKPRKSIAISEGCP